jgi:NADPH:quinone reductase-like Zn-dependent oxidoreductase
MAHQSETMNAIVIRQYGGLDVLQYERVHRPVPGQDEILVRIDSIGTNPVDYKTRMGRGTAGRLGANPFPLILGWDIAGVVEYAPVNSRFAVGDPVYGLIGFPQVGGAYAEYAVAHPDELARAPRSIDLAAAAAVPLVALTVWQAMIEAGQLRAQERVLIHAAAGGVGHIAVQMAKWRGAHVVGTASGNNADYLKRLGVDEVVDYQQTPFEDVVSDMDMVFDAVGGDTLERSFGVLKPGGRLITITSQPSQEKAAAFGVKAQHVLVHPSDEQLDQITALIDAGVLKPTIQQQLPLSEAREAHRLLETRRVRGKIVLKT